MLPVLRIALSFSLVALSNGAIMIGAAMAGSRPALVSATITTIACVAGLTVAVSRRHQP